MSDKDKEKTYFKIATIGETEVGKTCIIRRYVENTYTTNHLATIGVDYLKKCITIKDKIIYLQIFDTAGQEKFRNVTNQYFRNADGILLIFDVTKIASFHKIESWIKEINNQIKLDEIGMVLIGNKNDQTLREVTFEMGQEMAEKYSLQYFETSAQSGVNISESIEYLTRIIMRQKGIEIESTNKTNSKLTTDNNLKSSCC